MQADAEHQEDDADIGKLGGERLIGDDSGRERSDDDTSNQVADNRRKAQAVRNRAEDKGQAYADD